MGLIAVGHRVVQGGNNEYAAPVVIDDDVIAVVTELTPLAPLHNPAWPGIAVARQRFPDLPHVAVFDTAFHANLPPAARTYAIEQLAANEHRIRLSRFPWHLPSVRLP